MQTTNPYSMESVEDMQHKTIEEQGIQTGSNSEGTLSTDTAKEKDTDKKAPMSGRKEKSSSHRSKKSKKDRKELGKSLKQKGDEKKREFEDILKMKERIEEAIGEIDDGRFRDLSEYTAGERLLIFQNELLNKIRETKEYRDTLQRVAADFDNYRKRMEKEKENIIKFANEGLLLKLIEVLDNFERALDNVKDREDDPFVEGIRMIYNQFQKIITDEGLKPIVETGVEFDPHIHEAMMQIADNELKENTVTDVFQKGYILKDRVIRPAKVRISKKEA